MAKNEGTKLYDLLVPTAFGGGHPQVKVVGMDDPPYIVPAGSVIEVTGEVKGIQRLLDRKCIAPHKAKGKAGDDAQEDVQPGYSNPIQMGDAEEKPARKITKPSPQATPIAIK
jgi:hypothetical protein